MERVFQARQDQKSKGPKVLKRLLCCKNGKKVNSLKWLRDSGRKWEQKAKSRLALMSHDREFRFHSEDNKQLWKYHNRVMMWSDFNFKKLLSCFVENESLKVRREVEGWLKRLLRKYRWEIIGVCTRVAMGVEKIWIVLWYVLKVELMWCPDGLNVGADKTEEPVKSLQILARPTGCSIVHLIKD